MDILQQSEDWNEVLEVLKERGYNSEDYDGGLEEYAKAIAKENYRYRKIVDFVDSDHFDTLWRELVSRIEAEQKALNEPGDLTMNMAVRDAYTKGKIKAFTDLHQTFLDEHRKATEQGGSEWTQ